MAAAAAGAASADLVIGWCIFGLLLLVGEALGPGFPGWGSGWETLLAPPRSPPGLRRLLPVLLGQGVGREWAGGCGRGPTWVMRSRGVFSPRACAVPGGHVGGGHPAWPALVVAGPADAHWFPGFSLQSSDGSTSVVRGFFLVPPSPVCLRAKPGCFFFLKLPRPSYSP